MKQKTNHYTKMSNDDFDRILADIIHEESLESGGQSIFMIPGAYEVFAEHFNNEVLDRWLKECELE